MATIRFKTKVRNGIIELPAFKRSHCDMAAFRQHAKYGFLANSDLFPNALSKIRRDVIGSDHREWVRVENLPTHVTIDTSGFLATVTVTL